MQIAIFKNTLGPLRAKIVNLTCDFPSVDKPTAY